MALVTKVVESKPEHAKGLVSACLFDYTLSCGCTITRSDFRRWNKGFLRHARALKCYKHENNSAVFGRVTGKSIGRRSSVRKPCRVCEQNPCVSSCPAIILKELANEQR